MTDTPPAPRQQPNDPMENWLMKPALEWLEQAEHGENKSRCDGIAAMLRDLWRKSPSSEKGTTALTEQAILAELSRSGLVDPLALQDPECYDHGTTEVRAVKFAAAIRALVPSATAAMVLVPREPTKAMRNAGAIAIQHNGGEGALDALVTDAVVAYEAMLSAAPVENKGTAAPVEEKAPDRPDWAQQLPGAEMWDRIEKDAARYEYIRTLNPRQFAALYDEALHGHRFDDLVDRYRDAGGHQE